MNSISRIRKAIHREPVTPVARGELMLDPGFARKYLAWRGNSAKTEARSDTDAVMACCRALRLDLVCIQAGEITEGSSDLSGKLLDIDRIGDEGLFVFWVVNGAFQTAMARQGMMSLLMNIADCPEDIGRELRSNSERVAKTMTRGVAAGAHGIIIADDIAYRQSTYMSPNFVEQHLLPIWQTQVAAGRDLGVPVFLHSDGNLNRVLPYIVAAGFDGLQCIEPAAGMDSGEIKEKYGQDLCLMGNMDPSLLCVDDDRSDPIARYDCLRRTLCDLMGTAGSGGGYIFGSCSGLHAGMSPDLVHFMYNLVSELDAVSQAASP